MNVCALMDPKSVTPGRSNVIFIARPSFYKPVLDGALWQWCTLVRGSTTSLSGRVFGQGRLQLDRPTADSRRAETPAVQGFPLTPGWDSNQQTLRLTADPRAGRRWTRAPENRFFIRIDPQRLPCGSPGGDATAPGKAAPARAHVHGAPTPKPGRPGPSSRRRTPEWG